MSHARNLGLLVVTLIVALALTPRVGFADDITGSKHDFSSTGPNATFQGAGSECETCHLPHGTGSAQLLWNHTLSSNTLTFGTGAATVAGTGLPTDVGSSPGTSKFCLSCHDGSVAVGDTIVGTAWGTDMLSGGELIAPSGNLAGNHPVEIPYPDQASAVYNSITSFADPTGYQASPTGVKLFGTIAGQKGIGCASCHNPHEDANAPFLRVAESSLCSSCHIK